MTRTREERETIIRFDETDELAYLSTFSAVHARRWQRAGVALTQSGGEWRGRVPKQAVRACRKVRGGQLVTRKAPSRLGSGPVHAFGRSKSSGAVLGLDAASEPAEVIPAHVRTDRGGLVIESTSENGRLS